MVSCVCVCVCLCVCVFVCVCVCVYELSWRCRRGFTRAHMHSHGHALLCTRRPPHARAHSLGHAKPSLWGDAPTRNCAVLALVAPSADAPLALQNDSEAISGGESSSGLVTYAYLLEAECELLHRTMNPFEVLLVLAMYPFEVLFVLTTYPFELLLALRTVRGVPAADG
jgi:hypothetical protein